MDELTDLAWERMKQILDEEMPVSDGSSKPLVFWWYWAAAGLLLLLATGWWLWADISHPKSENNDLKAEAEQPVVIESEANGTANHPDNYTDLSISANSDQETTAREVRSSGKASPSSSPSVGVDNAVMQRDQPTALTLQMSIRLNDVEEVTNEDPALNQTVLDEMEATGPAISRTETGGDPSGDEAMSEFVAPVPFQTTQLATLPLNPLSLSPLPLQRINTYLPKPPLFTPTELYVGLLSRNAGGLNGGFIEIRSGLQLSDAGRWSIQSGLGLHMQQQPFTVSFQKTNNLALDQVNTAPDTAALDPGFGQQKEERQSITELVSSSGINLRTIYLDMPLALHWKANPKWSVETGIRFSWLLRSVWQQPNNQENGNSLDAAGYNLVLTEERQIAFAQSSTANSYTPPITFKLNNFYAAGNLGVIFRPSVRWRIRAQYQHSLGNTLDSGVYRSPERALWLGVGFRW